MKKTISLFLSIILIIAFSAECFAVDKNDLKSDIEAAMSFLKAKASNAEYGDEWVVLGTALNDSKGSKEYLDKYKKNIENAIKEKDGILSTRKYTEYARVSVALKAVGINPAKAFGYDVLKLLTDADAVKGQGINGLAWALIALDSIEYGNDEVKAVKDKMCQDLVSYQLENGGWSIEGKLGTADISLTAMVLTGLRSYMNYPDVKESIEKGLSFLSEMQGNDGSFKDIGDNSSEAISQVIITLCEFGIDLEDQRFVKKGNNLLDALMCFKGTNGGFKHVLKDDENRIATEQALLAMSAIKLSSSKSSIYGMRKTSSSAWPYVIGGTVLIVTALVIILKMKKK